MASTVLLGWLAGCPGRSPIPDPGTPVSVVKAVPAGSLVLTDCEPLKDDSFTQSILYALAPDGTALRWIPDGMPSRILSFKSAATTRALYFVHDSPAGENAVRMFSSLAPDGRLKSIPLPVEDGDMRIIADTARPVHLVQRPNADGGVTHHAEVRTPDGGMTSEIALPDRPRHFFPSPSGDAVLVLLPDGILRVERTGGSRVLMEDVQLLRDAAWSPDGKQLAVIVGESSDQDGGADVMGPWFMDADGSSRVRVTLPPRPPPDWLGRWLGEQERPPVARAVAWSPDGSQVALLSNHESACWSGGQDIPGGCEGAVYTVQPDGQNLRRISPRAFRCRGLAWLTSR